MNHEIPDVQAGFRKGRGTRDQIANICWIIEKAREFQKDTESFKAQAEPQFHCLTGLRFCVLPGSHIRQRLWESAQSPL